MSPLQRCSLFGSFLLVSPLCPALEETASLTVHVVNGQAADRPRRTVIVQSFADSSCSKPRKLRYVPMRRELDAQTLSSVAVPSGKRVILDFTLFEFRPGLNKYCSVIGETTFDARASYTVTFSVDGQMSSCTAELRKQTLPEGGSAAEFKPLADVCTIRGNKSGLGTAVAPRLKVGY